ncbi:Sensor histidine kinase YpdA [compost metagenome]
MQPLAENAFIYAIEPAEEGGTLTIRVKSEEKHVLVQVQDTGQGMDEEQLNKLVSLTENSVYKGHSTGIGIWNVIHRLQLFYGVEKIIEIESELGTGTCITLKLPRGQGV